MKSFIWSFLSACWSKMIRNCSVASQLRGTVLNGYKSFLTKTEELTILFGKRGREQVKDSGKYRKLPVGGFDTISIKGICVEMIKRSLYHMRSDPMMRGARGSCF